MRSYFIALSLASLATWAVAEGPKDDVMAAAKKLAEAANYTWTQDVEMSGAQFTPGTVTGKTEKGGFTLISQEGPDGNTTEVVKKGEKGATKSEEGWRLADAQGGAGGGGGNRPRGDGQAGAGGDRPPRGDGQGGGGRRGGGGGRMLLQSKMPAQQIEELVGKVKELKADGEAIVGDLSEEAAKELLSFRGGRRGGQGGGGGQGGQAPEISGAKASLKVWVKEGQLAKYELQLAGSMAGRDGQARDLDRLTTVVIKDVGSTKVEVPEEAKKALEGGAAAAATEAKPAEEKK